VTLLDRVVRQASTRFVVRGGGSGETVRTRAPIVDLHR
jgi:hypothetical protein